MQHKVTASPAPAAHESSKQLSIAELVTLQSKSNIAEQMYKMTCHAFASCTLIAQLL